MSETTPTLGLPYIMPSQAQKHVTHNEALHTLDALVQLTVISATISTPPSSPTRGDCYIVAAGGSGTWAGQENAIAVWNGTVWSFITPQAGWRAYGLDITASLTFDGTDWGAHMQDLQNVPGIGIGTSYDSTNPLSVAGDATLLNHDGNGHQLKLNKASTSDTASLLFQSDFSGRAEMGLAGNDTFQIKVSDDGSSFDTALEIDATSGTTKCKSLASTYITVATDTVAEFSPSSPGGFFIINAVDENYPLISRSGIFAYDVGLTPFCQTVFAGSGTENHNFTSLTGTSAASGNTAISARVGKIQIENRSSTLTYALTFLGGA